MKFFVSLTAAIAAALAIAACAEQPVQRVYVPGPGEQNAYQPQAFYKPLPPNGEIPTAYPPGYQPPAYQPQGGAMPPPMGQQPMSGQPGMPPPQALQTEQAFVDAYLAHRSPKLMVFVNRTIQGDPLPPDRLNEVILQDRQSININDAYGVTLEDYQMIEASLVRYFDNSGKVTIQDSDAARAKLNREQILRIENGDPAAARLLSQELQQDVLIRVTAVPTRQATNGQPAIRLIAKAVGTTDARVLAVAFVDMPLPMGKTNINTFTGYLATELMGDMAKKWMGPAVMNPIEVRIYKTAAVDDALKISDWLATHDGVGSVRVNNATGGSTTSYASLSVGYDRSPAELYSNLQRSIAASQGLRCVDMTNNTIDIEVTGPIQKETLTTTRRSATRPVTDEDRHLDNAGQPVAPPAPTPAPQ